MNNNMPQPLSNENIIPREGDGLLVPKEDLRSRIDGATAPTPEEIRAAALGNVEDAENQEPIDPNAPWLTKGDVKKFLDPELLEESQKMPGDKRVQ
jgi:hypothetical protein